MTTQHQSGEYDSFLPSHFAQQQRSNFEARPCTPKRRGWKTENRFFLPSESRFFWYGRLHLCFALKVAERGRDFPQIFAEGFGIDVDPKTAQRSPVPETHQGKCRCWLCAPSSNSSAIARTQLKNTHRERKPCTNARKHTFRNDPQRSDQHRQGREECAQGAPPPLSERRADVILPSRGCSCCTQLLCLGQGWSRGSQRRGQRRRLIRIERDDSSDDPGCQCRSRGGRLDEFAPHPCSNAQRKATHLLLQASKPHSFTNR